MQICQTSVQERGAELKKKIRCRFVKRRNSKKDADSSKKRGADLNNNTSLKKGAEMQRKDADLKSVRSLTCVT